MRDGGGDGDGGVCRKPFEDKSSSRQQTAAVSSSRKICRYRISLLRIPGEASLLEKERQARISFTRGQDDDPIRSAPLFSEAACSFESRKDFEDTLDEEFQKLRQNGKESKSNLAEFESVIILSGVGCSPWEIMIGSKENARSTHVTQSASQSVNLSASQSVSQTTLSISL